MGSRADALTDTETGDRPRAQALEAVVDVLECPLCGGAFTVESGGLRCPDGHRFDIAKQGYVSVLGGRSAALRADTSPMVAARSRVHDAAFFDPVVDALVRHAVEESASLPAPLVLDAGAGAGHYLRAVLAGLDGAWDRTSEAARGIGIDLSKYCARAIARGNPPAPAVVADLWSRLPIADDAASIMLSVFAPRNAGEFARVLHPDGTLLVVTPTVDHLAELIEPMGMISVDPTKPDRLRAGLEGRFTVVRESPVRYTVDVDAQLAGDLMAMGPSAFHTDEDDIRSRARSFAGDGTSEVTVSVTVSVCRPERAQRRTDS